MFNIISLFRDFNVHYTTKSKNIGPGWIGLACPYCGDKSDHLGYNLVGGYFHCWKCGGHPVVRTLHLLLGFPYEEVYVLIKKYSIGRVYNLRDKTQGVKHVEIPKESLSNRERKYLENRGFSSEYLEKTYGIKSGGIAGKWKFRIVIPIIQNNICVSLQGRSIIKDYIPKYIFLAEKESIIPAKHCIFNIDTCNDSIVLLEGVFGVFRFGEGFGCSFGVKLTSEQLALLCQFKRVIFLFDNDNAGRENADKYGTLLASLGIDVRDIVLEKDIDLLSADEVSSIKHQIKNI